MARGRTQRKEGVFAQEALDSAQETQEMTRFVVQQVVQGGVGEGVELCAREHKMATNVDGKLLPNDPRHCQEPI
jgi:hypothetical protein